MAFIVFWFGESSLTQGRRLICKDKKKSRICVQQMRDFSLATKRCKVFFSRLLVDSQTVACAFCLSESLFQHFLTVEDVDVAVVHGLHLASVEVIDLAVVVGSSFDLADTSLCSLVDNEGICLDRLQVVRAVEQLQLALIGGRAELADSSERALVGCCGDNIGFGRVFGSRAYFLFVKRDFTSLPVYLNGTTMRCHSKLLEAI